MNTHIDTLTEWWENAEKGTPREGDTYIARFPGRDGYETGVVDSDGLPEGMLPDTRVLSRAPKPKPAWHDAVAVIASTPSSRPHRRVWVRDSDGEGFWGESEWLPEDALNDPTPLIEAKVTNEMVKRVIDRAESLGYIERVFGEVDGIDHNAMAELATAALGLENA